MINIHEVFETHDMIEKENLDVRTITIGISLLDCAGGDLDETCGRIRAKILRYASRLKQTAEDISAEFGIPIVNKRISITPISMVVGSCCKTAEDYLQVARTLDETAREVGVNFLGGFSAVVSKGMTAAERLCIESLPRVLASTERICCSVNVGSTKTGIDMDAVRLMGQIIKQTSELTADNDSMGCAKLVVLCNAPDDNPFMAGAFHGVTEPDAVINVGVSGPGVVKALLSSGKKAIGAGAGNPPVIVDDTADIEKAAKDIVAGASFDNNLPCIAEKECFAFANIADDLIKYMTNNGAYLIKGEQIDKLVATCLIEKNGKYSINKDWVGRDASKFLKVLGIESDARLVICEVPEMHPFVQVEMMMPVLGIVRVNNIDEAIEMAVKAEHGNRHSAHIHSKNVDHLTRFARAVETTIFVKNAPSYAGIGAGGEGYTTFTIAGPTGEGLTAAHSFTRQRRCVLVDGLHIV